jgi:hypothetical protein
MGAIYRMTVKDPLGGKSEYFYNGLVGYGWYVSPRDYVEYEDKSTNNSSATVPKTLYYYDKTSKGLCEEIKSITYPEGLMSPAHTIMTPASDPLKCKLIFRNP